MASQNIKREPINSVTIPLRIREAPKGPRQQVQSQQGAANNMMPPPGSARPGYGNGSFGLPPTPVIDHRLHLWGQTTPIRSPQGHPGAHYGPIPVQGTPQDRFRREILGRGRGAVASSGPRWTPAPTPTQLSLRRGGPPQPYSLQTPQEPRQTAEELAAAPQQLSFACQRRGFNPMFEAFETPDGKHGCHVKIDGTLLRNGRCFETARQAKEDAAMKGLDYLRQKGWVIGPGAPSMSLGGGTRTQVSGPGQLSQNRGAAAIRPQASNTRPQTHLSSSQPTSSTSSLGHAPQSRASIAHLEASVARLEATITQLQPPPSSTRGRSTRLQLTDFHGVLDTTRDRGRSTRASIKQDQDVEMTGVPASGGSGLSAISSAQQAELLDQIQRLTGMDVMNPSRESAEVTRAYLEGLAVGSRLATVARRRSRSPTRSPQTSRGRRHRERSPADARVRLTPPPLYQRWNGRPVTDRYRPGEDGRLRDDTRARIPERGSDSVESGETSDHGSGRSSEDESRNSGQKRSSS
ncbi:hypothetical protein QBC41DRAFT_307745 [Cercophora samala]|uniref:Uncharacterized protein n=1 Tax=Cercophora samala TaxID=330535 RepID=A0AA39YXM7_9PEZI|nr:hypothetical protein QBC41DRAFT_307745 [Cercophora samala]